MNDINKKDDDLDAIYARYQNWNMDDARAVDDIPFLQNFQARRRAEMVQISADTLQKFKEKAQKTGRDYQGLIREALETYLNSH